MKVRENVLLFGCDGTLADNLGIFRQAFEEGSFKVGAVPYPHRDETHIRTLEALDAMRFHGVADKDFAYFAEAVRDRMDARRGGALLFPRIASVLARLRADGHRLAVISPNSERLVEATLAEPAGLFPRRVTGVGFLRKAETLAIIFSYLASNTRSFYVGDEIMDVHAAQAAGVCFAGVSWGHNIEETLQEAGCEVMLREPSDVFSLVGARKPVRHINNDLSARNVQSSAADSFEVRHRGQHDGVSQPTIKLL